VIGKRPELVKIAFGKALQRFRAESGLSQEKLAARAGVHRNYVGDVERGIKNICLLNMCRLTKALDVPLSKVMRVMERNL
jgi:transcriptional regulator with XRE-family HTH domain